jgi:predicted phage terminase large subunit-like protein
MPTAIRLDKKWTMEEVLAMRDHSDSLARTNFWAYRQIIHPTMAKGWFQRLVAAELQQFYVDLVAGKRPKLLLQSPPQHGKSEQVVDLISWMAGLDPDLRMVYGSFSDRLGIRANLWLQRKMDGSTYKRLFGSRINDDNVVTRSGMPLRNREILEWVHSDGSQGRGYFRNTTVMGSITGEGLDLGIIDDPIKGRAEASSPTMREKTWNWLTDDFMSRFSDQAGLLMIMTRWHMDDPAGRLLQHFPEMKQLRFKAIATEDEEHRKKGEALFPELKSLDFLNKQKEPMTQAGWESIYQQSPIVAGGGLFPIDKFGIPLPARPTRDRIKKTVRYWDKAGTQDSGAYTAGVRIDHLKEGGFVVSDVVRGQWSYYEREVRIKQTAMQDDLEGPTETWVEQEPGSGGKESAERTVAMLAGFSVHKDRVKGNKELRAEPYAAQVQAGNVRLVDARWNRDFLDEHEIFPNGKYKDQVDATGGAFAKLTARRMELPISVALPVYGSD